MIQAPNVSKEAMAGIYKSALRVVAHDQIHRADAPSGSKTFFRAPIACETLPSSRPGTLN